MQKKEAAFCKTASFLEFEYYFYFTICFTTIPCEVTTLTK
ncbi:MAG: hypothetical protein BWY22_01668 [Bacteroidetes bacterium ADurb.Bin217]|nr:MAG: hypothetical protein BWY22_01668 [Bacteroidetes bacterium ADurb.Bin217]